jgi:putative MATE family efflux protein
LTAAAAPAAPPIAARTRLLLEGPIAETLLRIAAPNLVVNVVLIAITTGVDAHFVGRLGPEALAGLALVFPLMMLMQQMGNFSMGGALAGAVARALGAGRREDAASLAVHGLIVGVVMAALFSAVLLLAGPSIYRLLGGHGATLAAAIEYSNAIFAGALAYWLLSMLTSVVRGTGQVAMLAWVYLAGEALHLCLVPLLVFGLGPVPSLGIAGAGIATAISFAASALLLAWYLASGRTPLTLTLRGIRIEGRLFGAILKVGVPLSLQPALNNAGLAALTGYAGMLGGAALAGVGAAVRLEYVMYPVVFGLGAAVVAMVGTNIGAGQRERAMRIAWTAAGLAAGATAMIGVVAFIWPSAWAALFTTTPDVAAAAATYLCIVALTYPFIGMNTLTQAFQAMGQTFWPLVAVAARTFVVVGGGYATVTMTDSGVAGLAAVTAASLVVAGTIIVVAFRLKTRVQPSEEGDRI